MENMEVKSHIQLPKGFLKRFEDKYKKFCYYDVTCKYIGTNGHANSINRKLGHFSGEQETFFNRWFETELPQWLKRVDNIALGSVNEHIDTSLELSSKLFIYMLLAREPSIVPAIKNIFLQGEDISDQFCHDYSAVLSLYMEMDVDFLKDYRMTVAVNRTEVPFVLPQCGIYYIRLFGYRHVFFPVSPWTAIAFIEPVGIDFIIHNGVINTYNFLNPDDVSLCNVSAVKAQCSWKNGFVICFDKNALKNAVESADAPIITY